jgi:DNA-binding NarL/FixJ family response regulator
VMGPNGKTRAQQRQISRKQRHLCKALDADAGLTDPEIASLLLVEQSKVRKHLEHVYEKLAFRSRTAAPAKLRGGEI